MRLRQTPYREGGAIGSAPLLGGNIRWQSGLTTVVLRSAPGVEKSWSAWRRIWKIGPFSGAGDGHGVGGQARGQEWLGRGGDH